MSISKQVEWAQKLQAIAQTGLNYNPPPFDRERYEQVREIAAEMLNADGSPSPDAIRALFDAQTGHATPKIDVRGVVFQDDKILLVQEKLDNFRWTLPGGWADVGESAGEAVAREIFEESGYATRAAAAGAARPQQARSPALSVPRLQSLLPLQTDRPGAPCRPGAD
ncbi:MAG: NUDIX hydrolase N-terminal domain-containing protein [Anaerolineae bacterium]